MSRLFDLVRKMSGQQANISITRPYIAFFKGNYTHAAVLSQLVFWSSTKNIGEWFYKANDELAGELALSVDQIRHSIRQIKAKLPGVLETKLKKVKGTPVCHYRIDGDKLINHIFPNSQNAPRLDMVDLPNQNGTSTVPIREKNQIIGVGKSTKTYNRSKPEADQQIIPKVMEYRQKSSQCEKSELDFSAFENISREQVNMLVQLRKKKRASVTQAVLDRVAREFACAKRELGMSLQDCLDEWEFRNWQSFQFAWVDKKHKPNKELNWDSTGWGSNTYEEY